MPRKRAPKDLALPAALPKPSGEIPDFTPVPRQRMRRGGWSADRQRAFIALLAETGSVRAACRQLGVGEHHIYKLRRHPEAASFRAAWEAALDCGIQRIEDIAMDRAMNGVEEPVYHAGEIIGTRRRYNDRLLMFMLKNRNPARFPDGLGRGAGGGNGRLDAIGKMEKRRLKKKWRAKWRRQWEAEKAGISAADVRAGIDKKIEAIRLKVEAQKRQEWAALSDETRRAFKLYERLRARDLGR